jgi:hypothetical protein
VGERASRRFIEFFTATIRTETDWLGFGSGCHKSRQKRRQPRQNPITKKALFYCVSFFRMVSVCGCRESALDSLPWARA